MVRMSDIFKKIEESKKIENLGPQKLSPDKGVIPPASVVKPVLPEETKTTASEIKAEAEAGDVYVCHNPASESDNTAATECEKLYVDARTLMKELLREDAVYELVDTLRIPALMLVLATMSAATPRDDSLRFNSQCIIAHADAKDYMPSTDQRKALQAASGDPGKVLAMLKAMVKEARDDFQNGVRLGTANPKLKGMDGATKRELVASFRRDGAKAAALLKELESIDVSIATGMPGAHEIKGKNGICPHNPVNGKLELAKFKAMTLAR